MKHLTLAACIAAMLSACSGGEPEAPVFGTCDVYADEPVLNIVSVKDATTGAALDQVSLTDLRVGGVAAALESLTWLQSRVVVSGQTLACTLPCGFGDGPMHVTLTVSALGYEPAAITVDASYSVLRGNCPGVFSGGTTVSVTLRRL